MKYYHNLSSRLIFLTLFFTFFLTDLHAQQEDPQIRLAQELENNLQYESALEIYRILYPKYPMRLDIIKGIKRCSISLQKYDELILFYENIIKKYPANSVWTTDLAEIYYMNNQHQKASDLWWTEIQKDPKNIAIYRLVGSAMITLRLYEAAIKVYLEAIKQMEGQSNLYIDIGNLYRQQLEYGKAAENYLLYYSNNPKQKSFLQRQVLNLSDEQNQTTKVTTVLENYVTRYPEQKDVKEILAGLYLKDKNFEPAFTIYKTLDTKDTRGQYLMNFAAEAFGNQAYDDAISAYKIIQDQYSDSPFLVQSIFETGRAHYAKANRYRENSDLKKASSEMSEAVLIFDSLAAFPKRSDFHAQSLVILGDIYYNFYFDLDKASLYYQIYIQSQQNNISREQVIIKLGDVFLCKNQLDKARTIYQQVSLIEFKLISRFKIAEMTYFQGSTGAAQSMLSELIPVLPSTNPLLNDALSRLMLIQSYAQDSLSLASYAHSELLVFQRRLSEAAEKLYQLAQENKSISALAGRKSAHLLLQLEKVTDARELLLKILTTYSNDLYQDETIFLLAQTEEKGGNYQQAVEYYQQLLSRFPGSFYIQQARENARRLTTQLKKDQS